MLNPYKILNLPKDATDQQIEAAFKQAAKKTHPDKGGTAEQFTATKRSRDLLLDPKRRQQYDQTGTIDEDQPNNPNAPVGLVMQEIMRFAIMFANGQGGDPTTVSLLDYVKKNLQAQLDKFMEQKAVGEKLVKSLKGIEKRLTRRKAGKKGSPAVGGLLKLAIGAQIATVQRDIAKNDPLIEQHELAIKLLDDWDFEVDPPRGGQAAQGVQLGSMFRHWTTTGL